MTNIYLILSLLTFTISTLPTTNGYPHFDHQAPDASHNFDDYVYDISNNHIDEPSIYTRAPLLADGVTTSTTISPVDEYLSRVGPKQQFEALLFSYQAGLLTQFHDNFVAGIPRLTEGGPNGTDCIREQKARRVALCPKRCMFDFDDFFPVAGCGPVALRDDTIRYMCCPPWVKLEESEESEDVEEAEGLEEESEEDQ